jgi:hypothetical protein
MPVLAVVLGVSLLGVLVLWDTGPSIIERAAGRLLAARCWWIHRSR